VELRQYIPWLVASVIGAALVTAVAFVTGSMAAVLFTGLGAGVVAGGIIATSQRARRPKGQKRRKR
jgi:ABC-type transport system involved in cytochrome bd biosynthesis fused ATPase/permease subunit